MIVDFVSIKKQLNNLVNTFLQEEVKKRAPLVHFGGVSIQHEGRDSEYETVDKQQRKVDFKTVESGFSLTNDEIKSLTFEQIREKVIQAADDMAGQMERGTFATLNTEIEAVGNSIPGNPRISPTAILDGFEVMSMDFDDVREKPILPTIFMHPDEYARLMREDASATEEEKRAYAKRREDILDKKFAEYAERESKRKLVD
jgi:hypothetical protein